MLHVPIDTSASLKENLSTHSAPPNDGNQLQFSLQFNNRLDFPFEEAFAI